MALLRRAQARAALDLYPAALCDLRQALDRLDPAPDPSPTTTPNPCLRALWPGREELRADIVYEAVLVERMQAGAREAEARMAKCMLSIKPDPNPDPDSDPNPNVLSLGDPGRGRGEGGEGGEAWGEGERVASSEGGLPALRSEVGWLNLRAPLEPSWGVRHV